MRKSLSSLPVRTALFGVLCLMVFGAEALGQFIPFAKYFSDQSRAVISAPPTEISGRYRDYSSTLVAEVFPKGDELAQCCGVKDHQTQDTEQCRTNR